jgi:hypothetical protein
MVARLMKGEAIYGHRLGPHMQPVWDDREESPDDPSPPSYERVSLYNLESHTIMTDFPRILADVGIHVENFQAYPLQLVISLETPRAAGVPLREVIIE